MDAHTVKLQPDEIEIARQLWLDLKQGVPDAPKQLAKVPEKIRDAVLEALVRAMDRRKVRGRRTGIGIEERGEMERREWDRRKGRDRRTGRDRRRVMDYPFN